jgi:hypothetical protein
MIVDRGFFLNCWPGRSATLFLQFGHEKVAVQLKISHCVVDLKSKLTESPVQVERALDARRQVLHHALIKKKITLK